MKYCWMAVDVVAHDPVEARHVTRHMPVVAAADSNSIAAAQEKCSIHNRTIMVLQLVAVYTAHNKEKGDLG